MFKKAKKVFLNCGYQVDRLHPVRLAMTIARKFGYALSPLDPRFPVDPPVVGKDLAVLGDAEFQRSIRMVREHTLLDVARLANLWNLVRQTGPGTILEVGTFRGGGALHLANACPEREIYVFDTFEGFGHLTPGLDDIFGRQWFQDTTEQYVTGLFKSAGRTATVVRGFFPGSAKGLPLAPVAFCHLDVDVFEATRDSLAFLAERLAPRSLIVVDDYQRGAHGLDQAVRDFMKPRSDFTCFPLFPGQCLLFSRALWEPQPLPTLV